MAQHIYLTREAILKELTCDGCKCSFNEYDVVFTDFINLDYCSECFKSVESSSLMKTDALERTDRELQCRMMDFFRVMYSTGQKQ